MTSVAVHRGLEYQTTAAARGLVLSPRTPVEMNAASLPLDFGKVRIK